MKFPNLWQAFKNIVTRPRPRYTGPVAGNGAGMLVTNQTALAYSAVWACVRIISESLAGLPWHTIRVTPDGRKERVTGTTVDWLLNKQANPEMTAFTWRELMLVHVLVNGNHYSEIQRDAMGRPVWLWPLIPETVRLQRDENGALTYHIMQEKGGEAILEAKDVLHIKGLGWDGVTGYSPITMARRSFGLGLAMDEYGANFYKNGTHMGLVLQHPSQLSEQATLRLKQSLEKDYSGPGNAFRVLVAEEGMTLSKAQMSMVDAQFLASREFQIREVCRWYRMPPHKLAELSRTAFANIESQQIDFVQDTCTPWARRMQQEIDIKLFGMAAQRNISTWIDVDSLQRGDLPSRSSAYATGRNGGWLSVNDIRHMENLNPIGEEGDIYLQPLNMTQAGEVPDDDDPKLSADSVDPVSPNPPAVDPDSDSGPIVGNRSNLIHIMEQRRRKHG